MVTRRQLVLFTDPAAWPEGFRYQPDFLGPEEERDLLARVPALPFGEVRMRGVAARRRTAQFGWRYSFETFKLTAGDEPPAWLRALQGRAEAYAGLPDDALSEILVTEYTPGATIGWHRDAPPFDVVVGISLASACRFRFRRRRDDGWETLALRLDPRSIYVLNGAARREWQHSIPAGKELRYSITFRSLKTRPPGR
jgi:alkylated DNA repair protein (DNA oxidative demethylase)